MQLYVRCLAATGNIYNHIEHLKYYVSKYTRSVSYDIHEDRRWPSCLNPRYEISSAVLASAASSARMESNDITSLARGCGHLSGWMRLEMCRQQ